jgi:hypothetical protein
MSYPRSLGGVTQRRTPIKQIELACRILAQEHEDDIRRRSKATFGDRANQWIPDVSRNRLRSWVDRINRTHYRPPLVVEMRPDLAILLGDASASVLVRQYSAAGGRPLPTSVVQADVVAHRYRIGVCFAGVEIGWSARSKQITLTPIRPCDLRLQYASDDPTEPTRIARYVSVVVGGVEQSAWAIYDLTDLDNPSLRIMGGEDGSGQDLTQQVHGETYEGADYWWRYSDGRPFHPIVITGNDRYPYETNPLVEATCAVAMRWTAWGVGTDQASHPARNVRGMEISRDTSASEGGHGASGTVAGPEYVHRWQDTDPERPGDHWQDAPAFDPLTTGKAIREYEQGAGEVMGLAVSLEQTGGEPTETERRAVEELISMQHAECRRFDSEILRRCAAVANRLPNDIVPGTDFDETPYEVLYRGEIDEALKPAAAPPPDPKTTP